jgi:hypothetical protein
MEVEPFRETLPLTSASAQAAVMTMTRDRIREISFFI